ncbi:MAG: 5'/3'-nucleotidase SurE [Bacteriovoracaceae bacterium]
MNVLLVNDDGVYAEGIKCLKNEVQKRFDLNLMVMAPLEERSTTGHTLTLDHPLRVEKISDNTYGCSGYPADCTLMGLEVFKREFGQKPDLVLSGINRGANLGQDIYYSGTVAAAREAAFHGIQSIAVSTVLNLSAPPSEIFYQAAAEVTCDLIEQKIHEKLLDFTMLNVNVPNILSEELKGKVLTKLGRRDYSERLERREDFRGRDYYWLTGVFNGNEEIVGSDCYACDNNQVSVTPLDLLNRYPSFDKDCSEIFKSLK